MTKDLTPAEHDAFVDAVVTGVEHLETRRRRRQRWAGGATAAVLVAVVVGTVSASLLWSPDQVARPAPTLERTTTPTPTPTPTVSPTPEVPAPDPTDPQTWVLSSAGMGPFAVGMPFEAAVQQLVDATEACAPAATNPQNTVWLYAGDSPHGTLVVVEWSGSSDEIGPHTAEGIVIGSSVAEVRAAYPDAVEVLRQGEYLQAGNMFFAVRSGYVESMGVTSADVPWEYCG